MSEPESIIPVIQDEEGLTFWDKHRFLLLISSTIAIAVVLTCISIVIYNVSGSAQLDLSRPGYQSVSDQADADSGITGFSAFGAVNKDTVNEFIKLYDEQAAKATSVDAFNGDPLNPAVLESSSDSSQ